MAGIRMRDYQMQALSHMKNGCILNGGVGSGKSRTALAYYYCLNGGTVNSGTFRRMVNPCDLYIITTARKRDTFEWEEEMSVFKMSTDPANEKLNGNKIIVDSWNNLHKYVNIKNAFFIFDEQRVVGYGAWTKAFLEITRQNKWILLSATPGDTWMDYIPVFIANGFFRNKTDFISKHVIFSRFTKFPKVDRYLNEGRLIAMRRSILVNMDFHRDTVQHHLWYDCSYDEAKYKFIVQNRWNPYTNLPIQNAGEYCYTLRRVVNSSPSRCMEVLDILKQHPKAIIFYSYDYELEILRGLLNKVNYKYSEWNGHKHELIPEGDSWAYLVEYTAGCEGWNCVLTDTIIFFSQNYSYKVMVQASGRIDRLNTKYIDLWYYHLTSKSTIDNAIMATLKRKKKFNEKGFAPVFDKKDDTPDKHDL